MLLRASGSCRSAFWNPGCKYEDLTQQHWKKWRDFVEKMRIYCSQSFRDTVTRILYNITKHVPCPRRKITLLQMNQFQTSSALQAEYLDKAS
jgi:hypothetical protein